MEFKPEVNNIGHISFSKIQESIVRKLVPIHTQLLAYIYLICIIFSGKVFGGKLTELLHTPSAFMLYILLGKDKEV
jgi:hypothetical protein